MTLIEHLTLVEETRSDINRKHDLVDVMFLVISAIMSGTEGWRDIETYGNAQRMWAWPLGRTLCVSIKSKISARVGGKMADNPQHHCC